MSKSPIFGRFTAISVNFEIVSGFFYQFYIVKVYFPTVIGVKIQRYVSTNIPMKLWKISKAYQKAFSQLLGYFAKILASNDDFCLGNVFHSCLKTHESINLEKAISHKRFVNPRMTWKSTKYRNTMCCLLVDARSLYSPFSPVYKGCPTSWDKPDEQQQQYKHRNRNRSRRRGPWWSARRCRRRHRPGQFQATPGSGNILLVS